MKKLIFTILLLSSFLAYSQEEMPIKQPSKFHHTIGLNLSPLMLGGYTSYGLFSDYKVPFGGKHWYNLIPYYELDYNNKIFLTGNYRYSNMWYKVNADMYYVVLSYNFFKSKSSHALKLGGGGMYYKSNKEKRISYVLALSYHEKINKHLGAGLGVDYSHFPSTSTITENNGMIIESVQGGFAVTHFYAKFSYTF